MVKKTITYTDYNDAERTEDFYFNLSKAELAEMQLTTEGGFSTYIQRIIDAKDVPALTRAFKDVLVKSYGKKSDDGRRFIKSEEITDEFVQTEAYSEIFMELVSDDKLAAEFVNGIIPNM